MISAKIICDSLSPQGHRITTFELVFPRMILAEAKTHRILSGLHGEIEVLEDISLNSFKEGSKNSASSRAIPFSKMVKAVQENPFIPIAWQKEHKGMQGTEYASYPDTEDFKVLWLEAIDNAVKSAQLLQTGDVKLTKQLCNRLLEPFMYHKVLLTATEFDNFFELRAPKYQFKGSEYFKSKKDCIAFYPEAESLSDLDWLLINKGQSEIHMMQLAECMYDAMNESVPKQLKAGEWHIPYEDSIQYKDRECRSYYLKTEQKDVSYCKDENEYNQEYLYPFLLKISTAKCARTSYTTVGEDGKEIPYEKDITLHDSLIASGHMSPTEHVCRAMSDEEYNDFIKGKKVVTHSESEYDDLYEFDETSLGWCLNYRGFIQYRYLLQNQ